jgi:hypothetical protein
MATREVTEAAAGRQTRDPGGGHEAQHGSQAVLLGLAIERTAATTSAVPVQRAISAGRRSIIAFQICRASS